MEKRFKEIQSCYFSVLLLLQSETVDDMGVVFQYELLNYPTSLFDALLKLLKPPNSALADGIWAMLPSVPTGPKGEVQCVLNEGRRGGGGTPSSHSVTTRISYGNL